MHTITTHLCVNVTQLQDEISAWESKLMLLQEGLSSLNAIQRKWLYLEPIFARGALPGQQGRFKAIDLELKAVMAHLQVSAAADLM